MNVAVTVIRNIAMPIAAAKTYILNAGILFDGGLSVVVAGFTLVFTSDEVGVDAVSV